MVVLSSRQGTRLAAWVLGIAAFLTAAEAGAQPAAPPLRDLPVSRLERMEGADLDGPRTLTVTFPKPASVRDVLLLLVRGTPLSAVLEGSVHATFTGELRELTIRQALEAVLFSTNLDYDLHGTVIRVFSRRPRTRLFELDLVSVRREWTARSGSLVTSSANRDPLADIDAGVRALLSQQGRHHLDRRAGLVSVSDFADRLDQIGLYLEIAQLRATRQVRIDTRVLHIALNDNAWGVDLWALAARGSSGIWQTAATSAGFVVTDFDAFVRALRQWGQVTSASAPRVLASNNEPALVRVAGSTQATEDGSASDLDLTVTPQISADGIVQLSLSSRFSSPAASGDSQPVGEAATVVRVRPGETVILSGLQHPAGGTVVGTRRAEVVVLLTTTLVGPATPSEAGER